MTWESLYDVIVGELRLPVEHGMRLTLNEILIMQLGRLRDHERHIANARLIMWEIRTKYTGRGKRIQPKDIFKLSYETPTEITRMSKEKFERINNLWNGTRQKN